MSAASVPTVALRADGTYAVPVAPGVSLVWGIRMDGSQPVLQVKVEQEGCKVYHLVEADSLNLPIDQ